MKAAFWDSSALVQLCVQQAATPTVRNLLRRYKIVTWWSTPVEMCSAFERLLRMDQLTMQGYAFAGARLQTLRLGWREMQPTEEVRQEAMDLLSRYPLRAADALQLAAAHVWTLRQPHGEAFISGDAQLSGAAGHLGFRQIAV